MTDKRMTGPDLDEHLRRTLRAVAATVAGEPAVEHESQRSRRRMWVGLGAVAVAVPLAAGAFYGVGSEYVDKIPPDNVIVAGSVDGNRYWMVEAFHKDVCGKPTPGVELLLEDSNLVGQEWNTHLITYGNVKGCNYDISDELANPSQWDRSGALVDDTMIWVVGVHPDITAVRATVEGSRQTVPVHRVDGAGYAVFEVPEKAELTVALVIDSEVVPGSEKTWPIPPDLDR